MKHVKLDSPSLLKSFSVSFIFLLIIFGLAITFAYQQLLAQQSDERGEVVASLQDLASDQRQQFSNPIQHLQGTARAPALIKAYQLPFGEEKIDLFVNELSSLVYRNPDYYQARWIAPDGQELVRVEFVQGSVVRYTSGLQNKAHRHYHSGALDQAEFGMYVAAPSLNREYGEIVVPWRKSIRYAVRLPNNGIDNGYLIINYRIRVESWQNKLSAPLRVAADNGDWVVHENESVLWDSEFNHGQNARQSFAQIWQAPEIKRVRLANQVWAWTKITPQANDYYSGSVNSSAALIFMVALEPITWSHWLQKSLWPTWFVALVLWIAAFMFIHGLRMTQYKERLYQQALAQRTAQAEQSAQAKSQFLANMSHEIRTPMNAISGFIEVMKKGELSNEQSAQIDQIHRATKSLVAIINDILDLSKLEAGKMTMSPGVYALSDVAEDAIGLFWHAAKEKGVNLLLWIDPAIHHEVSIDRQRLGQILNNLLSNALKFTHQGYVKLALQCLECTDTTMSVQVSVIDTGKGIDPEKLDKIFEQFSQEDDSTTRHFGGTGLGLTISNALLELLNASKLQVVSKQNHGSTFSFTLSLPIVQVLPNAQLSNSLPIAYLNSTLVVEDIVQPYFTAWGCQKVAPSDQRNKQLVVDTYSDDFDASEVKSLLQQTPIERVIYLSDDHHRTELEALAVDSVTIPAPFLPSKLLLLMNNKPKVFTPAVQALDQYPNAVVAVIDDTPANLLVAQAMLGLFGVVPVTFEDGLSFLNWLQNNQPDLVLLDIHMPNMNGLEVVAKLRQQWQDLPVVALSAAAMQEDVERSHAAGMNQHMAKPFSTEDLQSLLWRYLSPDK